MGSFLSSPATDADLLASPDAYDSRSLRKSEGYRISVTRWIQNASYDDTQVNSQKVLMAKSQGLKTKVKVQVKVIGHPRSSATYPVAIR